MPGLVSKNDGIHGPGANHGTPSGSLACLKNEGSLTRLTEKKASEPNTGLWEQAHPGEKTTRGNNREKGGNQPEGPKPGNGHVGSAFPESPHQCQELEGRRKAKEPPHNDRALMEKKPPSASFLCDKTRTKNKLASQDGFLKKKKKGGEGGKDIGKAKTAGVGGGRGAEGRMEKCVCHERTNFGWPYRRMRKEEGWRP